MSNEYYMTFGNSVFSTEPKEETYKFKAEDVSAWETEKSKTDAAKSYHEALKESLASYIEPSNVSEAKDAVVEVKDVPTISWKADTNAKWVVNTTGVPAAPSHDFKFNEDHYLREIQDYIVSTYKAHYAKGGKTQAFELIASSDKADGFTTGSIMKYAARYGEKDGYNRKDLLKIAHYAILQLFVHDLKKRN
jgi:Protein of unknwon function (DUF3310)